MISKMIDLLKPYWLCIIGFVSVAIMFVLTILQAYQTGKNAVRLDSLKKTLNAVKERENIKYNINKLSIDQRNKLRKRWERD